MNEIIIKEAHEIVITKDTMSDAVEILSKLNQQLDKVTEEREKVTAPLNAALKAERARWKPHETALEGAITALRTAMTAYQTNARKEEEAAKLKLAERVAKGTLKVETAVKKLDNLETPDAKVFTESGTVSFTSVKKFELEDITKVPTEYLLLNEVAVRKAMKEGVELAGIRYFTEEVVRNMR